MAQRDERKQTADDVSKAYRRCRNRGEVVNPGRVWGVSWLRPRRHPAWRRR